MDGKEITLTRFPSEEFMADLARLIFKHGIHTRFTIGEDQHLPATLIASTITGMLTALYIHHLNVEDNDRPDEEQKKRIEGN